MVAAAHKMSVSEFERYAAEHGRCELLKGEVRPLVWEGGTHGALQAGLASELHWHVVTQLPGGAVFAAGTGFRLDDGGEPTVRAPDIAYIRPERAAEADTPRFVPVAPDLVGEILSPDDRASEVAEKVRWWLSHGVRVVWVVDPANQTVTVHHPDGSARVLEREQTLEGGEVLPGFVLPLTSLFSR